jgi:hypothetical protein
MKLSETANIVLPELEEPFCCTNALSDNSQKPESEYWHRQHEIMEPAPYAAG